MSHPRSPASPAPVALFPLGAGNGGERAAPAAQRQRFTLLRPRRGGGGGAHHTDRGTPVIRAVFQSYEGRCALILVLCIGLLISQGIAIAAALPSVTLSAPARVLIGGNFNFTATFDSAGTSDYGPFIDLVFPTSGADGNDVLAQPDASVLGTWVPIDTRDPSSLGNASVNAPGPEHTLTAKSIAIQKSVAIIGAVGMPGYLVGDTLEHILQFQVSDYFAFRNIIVDDTLSDGQRYDSGFSPTLAVNGNECTLPAAINAEGDAAHIVRMIELDVGARRTVQ